MRFSGFVKTGKGRGKRLGFPTANMEPPKDLKDGLYIGLANSKPALIFVGVAETFDEHERRAEVYILDFDGHLYNQSLEVEIIKKIRDNRRFPTHGALVEQMKEDERVAREFFENYNKSN
jgi:riboflavin kinase / FMN adenylyltransferase